MTTMPRLSILASTILLSLGLIAPTQAQQAPKNVASPNGGLSTAPIAM
jgi:hypothetical protein